MLKRGFPVGVCNVGTGQAESACGASPRQKTEVLSLDEVPWLAAFLKYVTIHSRGDEVGPV